MSMIVDFLSSDIWKNIQPRVIATFGLSGAGTVANAIPYEGNIVIESFKLTGLIEIFTLVSYGMSILVAVTVLYRFFVWFKERKKK